MIGTTVDAQLSDNNPAVSAYILQYRDIAVQEMKEFRIPASITLAQGILESNAGRSDLAVKANNHFGIKCHRGWTGQTVYKDDETKNECFRKYDSPLESFHDHSQFLTGRERYKPLFSLDIRDYKAWASGLKSAGYATNPAYADLLIRTIEKYRLYLFDDPAYAPQPEVTAGYASEPAGPALYPRFKYNGKGPDGRDLYLNNQRKALITRENDLLYLIARNYHISVGKLLKYNDLAYASAFRPGQILYLESKRRKGESKIHTVQPGETLYSISQLYGIRMKQLCRKNNLLPGGEPAAGRVLRLR
jgi:hypothetical protein